MIRTSLAALLLLCTTSLFADPVVLQSRFDATAGPNFYEVNFPIELGGATLIMPIVGGEFDLEIDAEAGTSRILKWDQDVSAIDIFGMSTGPIKITVDAGAGSSGTYDSSNSHFNVAARFLISFDDTQLREFGFFSPIALDGTEDGNIYGVGSIGSISMFLAGGGSVAGGSFTYTCRTSARFDYLLDDDHAQPGDVNHDRNIDLSDPVAILSSLFAGAAPLACPSAVDVTGDGASDISDAVFLLSYLFRGGSAPSAEPVECPAGS